MKSGQVRRGRGSALPSAPKVAQVAPPRSDGLDNPIFPVAMLRIAMELRKKNAPSFETILRSVVEQMKIDRDAFLAYLERFTEVLRVERDRKRGRE